MLRSDLCDFSDACIAVEGDIIVNNPDDTKIKVFILKIMHHLSTLSQKRMVYKLTTQKI